MTTPAQIQLPLFAPAAPKDGPAQLLKPSAPDKQEFDSLLERQIQQPHLDRAERRPDPEPEAESRTRADVREHESSRTARRHETRQDTFSAQTTRAQSEHNTETQQPAQEHRTQLGTGDTTPVHERDAKGAANLTPEQKLIRHLKDLDIDQERIDAILNTIRQGAGGDKVIAALADFLGTLLGGEGASQLAQATNGKPGDQTLQTLAALFQNTANPTDTARTVGEQVQHALDVLKQAGLSQEEASRLLAAARQGNLTSNSEDLRAKLAQVTEEGPLTAPKTEPETKPQASRAAASKLPVDESPISNELQRLSNLLGNKSGNHGTAQQDQAAGNLPQTSANSLLLNAQNVNPQVTASAGRAANLSPSITVDGGSVQPAGSTAEGTARPGEAVRAAVTESYTPRGLVEKPVAQQIVEKFSLRGIGQQKEVFIKLDPPHLGTVRMNVSTNGDHVKTTLVAENHAAKQTIENNLAQLKDTLAGQGVKVDSFTVLVGGNPGESAHQRHEGMAAMRHFGTQHDISVPVEAIEDTPPGRSPVFYYPSQSISLFA